MIPLDKLLMVLSGKGGVGKTITAINIAYGLSEAEKKVALIDCDVSNPNCAELLGIQEEIKLSSETQEFIPIVHDGVEFFSMANICGDRPVSMEASMYAQVLRDVLQQKNWAAETAICDMSAGIHDEFLEVVNVFGEKLLGSIIVFLPSHTKAARRMLKLHRNEGIPVIGIIENMSYFNAGAIKYHPFGKSTIESLAEEFGVKPLGTIPLSMEIRKGIEQHNPILPESLNAPIKNAVSLILEAEPVGVSFAEKIKEKLKGVGREAIFDVFASIVEIANTEINLADIQKRHAFPGGRTVELDITEERLRKVKAQLFLRLENAVWKVVKNPKSVHDEVRVWDKAFIWSVLGRRGDTEEPYDLMDAWLSGKARYFSLQAGTQRAIRLMRDVWQEVRESPSFNKLRPLLEKLA